MKEKIHPNYKKTTISCACGNVIETSSLEDGMKVEICNACHPFFTGTQKIIDTEGRVEKFKKRYAAAKGKK
ncbi:MAG: 50S ribosomal protein L31 [Candidatus Gastranaerophilales bacterium]|nr:50S ribosomal protein L31 [Candidatus Gastranaerophilales bacterium]